MLTPEQLNKWNNEFKAQEAVCDKIASKLNKFYLVMVVAIMFAAAIGFAVQFLVVPVWVGIFSIIPFVVISYGAVQSIKFHHAVKKLTQINEKHLGL